MKVFLDLDGVIVDFVKGACLIHGRDNPYEGPNPSEEWHIDQVFGMTATDFWDPMNNVNFWATLEFTKDGKEILKAVEDKFGEENICLLTSPILAPECSQGKHWWITKYLPRYKRRFFIGPAKHFVAGSDKLLIDDHDMNVETFQGNTILVPRQYNKNRGKDTLAFVIKELENYIG